MLPNAEPVVDCGDVAGDPSDGDGSGPGRGRRPGLLERDVIPVVLGGDSIPIPVLAAYDGHGPLTVLQVDAHLDFRHEVGGDPRLLLADAPRSEMGHVERSCRSACAGWAVPARRDVEDAGAAGGLLVTARQLRERGVGWVLDQPGGRIGLHLVRPRRAGPQPVPGRQRPVPGGLSWDEAGDLLSGAATRCRVVGAAFTELAPDRDPTGTRLVAGRLVIRLLSALP